MLNSLDACAILQWLLIYSPHECMTIASTILYIHHRILVSRINKIEIIYTYVFDANFVVRTRRYRYLRATLLQRTISEYYFF